MYQSADRFGEGPTAQPSCCTLIVQHRVKITLSGGCLPNQTSMSSLISLISFFLSPVIKSSPTRAPAARQHPPSRAHETYGKPSFNRIT